ncbi:Clan SC, family S33, methylesterase-like serine peptidase [Tritrichomonas foetus]|uniref:Protein phosphatase methylesterase 1 n=1 Tax=Tritrichomonas foetus TaxID=1144522 RepID=A0A1J4KJ96_9EUKA|nr:Clan SC, family S33, methylesterase-like serine peptidase [Tritrichomonas foetus]|eukprot:OHT09750.1 Clan SC, family S33, methylesterase-like serine peptidase [Tritrichomonas foetus]
MRLYKYLKILSNKTIKKIFNQMSDGFEPYSTYWSKKETITAGDRGNFNIYSTDDDTPFVLLCIHGAGHSGLSFSLLAEKLKGLIQVYAPDLKCHGETPGDPAKDLSINELSEDVVAIANTILPEGKKLFLMGHSLGGSIATYAAYKLKPAGLLVLDTIEGIAIAAMPGMRHIVTSRPQTFKTAREAVRFVATSGEMMNEVSSKVSTQGRVALNADGKYAWITNLLPSEPYWIEWFKGFADKFVKAPSYKILILPNIDRLDTPFTIAHMQGKFQLEIVHGTNHCMHEDRPDCIADIVKNFLERLTAVPFWK